MKKITYAATALMLAATPVFAQSEAEMEESGVIGMTPIALGIATPVQIPWGINRWDVFGLDINLFYSDAPKMYGIDIGGLAELTRDTAIGLLVGGLANVAYDDVYGMRATLGLNYGQKGIWGLEAGLVGVRDNLHGVDISALGTYQRSVCGLQIGGLANVATVESYGLTVAGLANLAKTAYGLQLALLFNMT